MFNGKYNKRLEESEKKADGILNQSLIFKLISIQIKFKLYNKLKLYTKVVDFVKHKYMKTF